MSDPKELSKFRKRRGTAKGSITRIETRLHQLESEPDRPDSRDAARQMLAKLKEYDVDFRKNHLALIDLIDEDDALTSEQGALDEHDDLVATLTVRILALADPTTRTSPTAVSARELLVRRCKRMESRLSETDTALTSMSHEDVCRIQQYREQTTDFKKEIVEISDVLLSLTLAESDSLPSMIGALEKTLFDLSLRLKELSRSSTTHASGATHTSPTPPDPKGIRLPKLEVPVFNGHILNWRCFWEQFVVSIHDRPSLSNAEKLVYLQQALKGGSAKSVIEGLSRSGDNYQEAIKCLKERYDRPRLIHQAHVKAILEAAPLKDGNGKEIRKLHDTIQQHLRALKGMDCEPSSPFITSMVELKLDQNTMFEWQKHSQKCESIPHYQDLLQFLNLRAQATESSLLDKKSKHDVSQSRKNFPSGGSVLSYATNAELISNRCVVCKSERHPLYACPKFRDMPHDEKLSTLRANRLCMNCLGPKHFVKQCKSVHKCKTCQKPHHTLLHVNDANSTPVSQTLNPTASAFSPQQVVNSTPATIALEGDTVVTNLAIKLKSNSLLMTCHVTISAPDGTSVGARALLDNASSASFVSERLAQSLHLPRAKQKAKISGIAGLSHSSTNQSLTSFSISPVTSSQPKVNVTAVVVPKVTGDLPFSPIPFNPIWNHLSDLELADPGFGQPGRIDLLLGIDVFVAVLLHGRRSGPPGTPVAFETCFGWVLAGSTEAVSPIKQIATHHVSCLTGDDILRKFWEVEDSPLSEVSMSPEERFAVQHFKSNHCRSENGRFVVPLPRKENAKPLGESRSLTVRRFLSLERTLHHKNHFEEFGKAMQEYFDLGHAELVPLDDLNKPVRDVFYMPMHAVRKEASTTTKLRVVFDASMKTSSGVSLNDLLVVGPTVHPPLVDVLLRFRTHRIAMVADISKMYRAIELPPIDRDLHRFVWRANPNDALRDFRMTRVTFGVSSSSFVANMSVKENAVNFAHKYPMAAKVVNEAFYVDDCLTGADTTEEAVELQRQLHNLFSEAEFILRKWNSSSPDLLRVIPHDLRDTQTSLTISSSEETYTKTLGIEWHSVLDHFRLSVSNHSPPEAPTKRALVSDIAKTYDVLGWFAPAIIKVKILLQKTWEAKIGWDDCVPQPIVNDWLLWRTQLTSLSHVHIPRCYFPKEVQVVSSQLHGFCDASESAYAGVAYLRTTDSKGEVHISLVASKTRVAPIKRLTIPRLELCGAHLLATLLEHVRLTLNIPVDDVHAWTDSTIVINWLDGNPRRFRTYVGNRISFILDRLPPSRWNHVPGEQNPADCASRGVFPQELIEHELWWRGPAWLKLPSSQWPGPTELPPNEPSDEQNEVCLFTDVETKDPLVPLDRFSSFNRLTRVTAWVLRFVSNCRIAKASQEGRILSPLTVEEIVKAENYWISYSQKECFSSERAALNSKQSLPSNSSLINLHPFLDSNKILRVGGRDQNSKLSYSSMYPVILSGKHAVTKVIISTEHLRLLHAGPTLLSSSLNRKFHIVGGRKSVHSITRGCVACRRHAKKPKFQQMGQLPIERVTPDLVFENVGIDYAGPVFVKYGYVRKPTIVKAYICIFVSLTVKAAHLELVSDLTTDAFVSALRRFIARRGKPKLLWSDHGTNFVGAHRELDQLMDFLRDQQTQKVVSQFCTSQKIAWKFIPERSPHFGGLWESCVKSTKYHLKRVLSGVKLTFEEYSTLLAQVEACLNSRPLVAVNGDDDGCDALTPGHFLIGRPLEALPDPAFSYRPVTLLRRWHLCQNLLRHFWQKWSVDYLTNLRKYTKWHKPSPNLSVGDVVVLNVTGLTPTTWVLGRVTEVFPGNDGLVRVVNVKTKSGVYKRPVHKLSLLLSNES